MKSSLRIELSRRPKPEAAKALAVDIADSVLTSTDMEVRAKRSFDRERGEVKA